MYPCCGYDGGSGRRNKPGKRNYTLFIFLILLWAFSAAVSADTYVGGLPLTTVQSGIITGGVYMDANNTWWPASPGPQDVSKTFAAIPDVDDIAWARLYVGVYCGHMQNNYMGTVATTFDGDGDGTYETVLGTETLNVPFKYIINGGNDNRAFAGHGAAEPYRMVNDHTNRVTSDYVMWYNVTSAITSKTPKAHVMTSAVSGSFDGRIKLITLVVAYNDGDSDTIHYWVNQGHDTVTYYDDSGFNGMTEFDLSSLSGTVESASLMVNHMASSDGLYQWNGYPIDTDPPGGNFQGAYFGYNIWNVKSLISLGNIHDLSYDRSGIGSGEFSGQFYKIPLAVLSVRQSPMVAPVADFSADPVSGETPLTVRFTDKSSGPPSSWKWEYRYKPNDGSSYSSYTQFATTKNPSYNFTGIGSYIIRLTATNPLGSNSKTRGTTSVPYITIIPALPPIAAFVATPTSGTAPLTVSFTDQSTGTITSWAWDFENDGTVDSTQQNPAHTYTTPGTYEVKLGVTGPGGTDDQVKTRYITVTEAAPVAEFTATPRSGYPPLAVTFTDQSVGSVTTWQWDFENDGTVDSTSQNPVFSYAREGIYNVTLTVTGPGGSDTELKTGYISVATTAGIPRADFSVNRTVVNKYEPVKFTDKSAGIITVWAWDFNNDGVTDSAAQDPVYSYGSAGTYTVNLAVAGPGGSSNEKKIDYIKVRGDPDCDLTITGPVNPVNLGSTVFAKEPNTIRIIGVRNNGPSASPATTIELAASDGYKARGQVAALASGANTTITITDPTVRSGAGATIRYNVTVDPDDEIAEIDETNNFRLSADKIVTYNGYKGKQFWDGGDITTAGIFDLNGGLVHSFGDSIYRSGSFGGSGWTSYTVTWDPDDLPLPSNATVKRAILYVPYTWDNSNAAESISIIFNGESRNRGSSYKDRSNFGAYADYNYGLQTYDVTSSFRKNSRNTATFSRSSANAKLSMYGFTLAVVYEDLESSRKQIFLNEGFDLLGADESGYGTTPEEATAYVSFSGLTVDPAQVSRADLITFVASGDGEGTLLFNGAPVGGGWDFGSVSGPQVAVLTRDVRGVLQTTGNRAAIRSTPGETPAMAAIQQFLIVEYGKGSANTTAPGLVADFSAEPLSGTVPLRVAFTDLSTGNPISWAWDFDDDHTIDATAQHPEHVFEVPGNYTVNLTIRNATAVDMIRKTGYIFVMNTTIEANTTTAPPVGDLTVPDQKMLVSPVKDTHDTLAIEPLVTADTPDPPPSKDPVVHLTRFLTYVADLLLRKLSDLFKNIPLVPGGGRGA